MYCLWKLSDCDKGDNKLRNVGGIKNLTLQKLFKRNALKAGVLLSALFVLAACGQSVDDVGIEAKNPSTPNPDQVLRFSADTYGGTSDVPQSASRIIRYHSIRPYDRTRSASASFRMVTGAGVD